MRRKLFLEEEFNDGLLKLEAQKVLYKVAEKKVKDRIRHFFEKWKGLRVKCNNPDARLLKHEKDYRLVDYRFKYKDVVHELAALNFSYLEDFSLCWKQYRSRKVISVRAGATPYLLSTPSEFDSELDAVRKTLSKLDNKYVSPILNTISYLKYLDKDISKAYREICRAKACPIDVEKSGLLVDPLKLPKVDADTLEAKVNRAFEAIGYGVSWGVSEERVLSYLIRRFGPPEFWDEEDYRIMEIDAGADINRIEEDLREELMKEFSRRDDEMEYVKSPSP